MDTHQKRGRASSDLPRVAGPATEADPRSGCCWRGEHFLNALKAMITRQLFLLHSLLVTWRATLVAGGIFWLLGIMLLGQVVETLLVLILRRGVEWMW